MPIYTRTGDTGKTALFNGQRIKKSSLRVTALGHVDELNSSLGILRAGLKKQKQAELKKLDRFLESLQKTLFEVGSELAGNLNNSLSANYVAALEATIDYYQSRLPRLNKFVLPTGNTWGAWLYYTRAICRRTERVIIHLDEEKKLNPELIKFFNRLSDLLFVLARYVNQVTQTKETYWPH